MSKKFILAVILFLGFAMQAMAEPKGRNLIIEASSPVEDALKVKMETPDNKQVECNAKSRGSSSDTLPWCDVNLSTSCATDHCNDDWFEAIDVYLNNAKPGDYKITVTSKVDTRVDIMIDSNSWSKESEGFFIQAKAGKEYIYKFNIPQPYDSDITFKETKSQALAKIGEKIPYEVTITNNGPDTATDLLFSDMVRISQSYVTDDKDVKLEVFDGGSRGMFCQSEGIFIRCRLNDLPPGASETISMAVTPFKEMKLIHNYDLWMNDNAQKQRLESVAEPVIIKN